MNRRDILLDVTVKSTIHQWCLRVAFMGNLPGRKKSSKVWKIPHQLKPKSRASISFLVSINLSIKVTGSQDGHSSEKIIPS